MSGGKDGRRLRRALCGLGLVAVLWFAAGHAAQAQSLDYLGGKIFRIGHLGDLNELMLLGAIAGAEMAMLDAGVSLPPSVFDE